MAFNEVTIQEKSLTFHIDESGVLRSNHNISSYDGIEFIYFSGIDLFSYTEVTKKLEEINEHDFIQNCELTITTNLKTYFQNLDKNISKFKSVTFKILIDDVFERYDFLNNNWGQFIENLSLLSFAITENKSPSVTMVTHLGALNILYIDEVMRFYYTDLRQLFPHIHTNLNFEFQKEPKNHEIRYLPDNLKKDALKKFHHFLSTDEDSILDLGKPDFIAVGNLLLNKEYDEVLFNSLAQEFYSKNKSNEVIIDSFKELNYFFKNPKQENITRKKDYPTQSDEEKFESHRLNNNLMQLMYSEPDNINIREKIFLYFLKENKYEEVIINLREMCSRAKLITLYVSCIKKLVKLEFARGNYQRALPFLMTLYDREISITNASNLAFAYSKISNPEAAEYYSTKALELNSENRQKKIDKLNFLYNEKKEEAIKDEVRIILETNTREEAEYVIKSFGWYLHEKKDFTLSIYIFRRLLTITDDFETNRVLAELFFKNLDSEQSIFHLKKALIHDEENIDLLKQLGWRLKDVKDFKSAKIFFSKALAINKDDLQAKHEMDRLSRSFLYRSLNVLKFWK